MHEAESHRDRGVEMLLVTAVAGHERDHQVGMASLRADVGLGVPLAAVQLLQHLVSRVATPRAVALDLPPASQILGRVEVDADVVDVAHCGGVEAQRPFDDREPRRLHVLGRLEGPAAVTVDRLEDRLPGAQVLEVLGQHVKVIAIGVRRREPALGALLAVVAVVVVGRDMRDLRLPEDPDQPARQRGLSGGRVADDAKQDRTGHQTSPVSTPSIAEGAWAARAVGPPPATTTATPASAELTRGTRSSTDSRAQSAMSSPSPDALSTRASAPAASASSGVANERASPSATSAASVFGPDRQALRRPATYTSSSATAPSVPEHTSCSSRAPGSPRPSSASTASKLSRHASSTSGASPAAVRIAGAPLVVASTSSWPRRCLASRGGFP